jgi:phage terminase large subunit
MRSSRLNKKTEEVWNMIEDPVQFAEFILKLNLTAKQREVLRSVAKHPRTAVKACHASGKTFIAAVLVLWFITRYKEAIVITTAPTWMQVKRVLWGEIHQLVHRSPIPYPEPLETSLRLGPGRYAIGLSTNEGVRIQGFHAKHILIVLDEAPGVSPGIYEAIEGIRAGGDVRVLALGNPTIASGPFYDAFTANRQGWNVISISAFDTPNLQGLTLKSLLELSEEELNNNPVPYLTTRQWVKEKYQEWGLGSPLWECRVLGNFPVQSDDALISLAWLETARDREGGETGSYYAGLDVGGPGESETVLCVRDGQRIVHLEAWSRQDPRGKIVAALRPFKDKLITLNVDRVGIGEYMAKHLEDLGYPVRGINVGERSSDPEKFVNLKSELFWGLRERAEAGEISGLTDDRTIAQLTGLRYLQNSRGQIVIESKDDARKRGVKSPDRAEAVMLAFAEVQLGEVRVRFPLSSGFEGMRNYGL